MALNLVEKQDMEATSKVPGAPGAIAVPEDPTAPSQEVSSRRQRLSDIFTIVRESRDIVIAPFDVKC